MRFDCGPTYSERIKTLTDWHSWYAWRPVRVGSRDCRWMEYVWRKGRYHSYDLGAFWTWEYRA